MFEDMFNGFLFEDVFTESTGVTLTTDENGFVTAECAIDESNVLDTDPFEFITEAMYQNVINANNINMAILAENYQYLRENGIELRSVQEAAEQKEKKKGAIRKFFETIIAKIKKFFTSVIEKMKGIGKKVKQKYNNEQYNNLDWKEIDRGQANKYEASSYTPSNVVSWAKEQFDNVKNNNATSEFKPSKEKKKVQYISVEWSLVKRYEENIAEVKKLENDVIKFLKDLEKETLADLEKNNVAKAAQDRVSESFAKRTNAAVAISKQAVQHIQNRANEAIKIVNSAVAAKNGKKESTDEAASYLESLVMI